MIAALCRLNRSSGETESWQNLAAERLVTLTEGSPEIESHGLRPRNYNRTTLQAAAGELSAPRPDLTFDFVSEDGGTLSLSELDHETVVLSFWATWCTACRAEMPDLEELYGKFGRRGVRFFGISLDEGRETKKVSAFLEDAGVSYEQLRETTDQQAPFASLGSSPREPSR